MDPVITALVPVYQGEGTVRAALESLFSQEVTGLEVLVLDDGSSDRSYAISQEVSVRHAHVDCTVLRHPNMGLAATLNRGLSLARGEFVARLDADDLALPGRLSRQLSYLRANPRVAVVGTSAAVWRNNRPINRTLAPPLEHDTLLLALLFANPMVHSSILARTSVLREVGGYSLVGPAQDYELWSRIARSHKLANLKEALTVYQTLPNSISRARNSLSIANGIAFSTRNLHHVLQGRYSNDECGALAHLYYAHSGTAPDSRLTPALIGAMLALAATTIGGQRHNWSREFRRHYRWLLRRLITKWALTQMPRSVRQVLMRRPRGA